jgi:peptide/nickel transport system permease protein
MSTRILRDLFRRPLAAASAGYLVLVLVAAVGASWLAPDGPEAEDLAHVLSGPSAAHWLGTDRLGRDVLSRLMFGGRITLLGVAEALVVFAGLGITLGLFAGFTGGWADRMISRFGDLVLALPGIIVLLMVLSVFPGSELATMIALGLISCPTLLRVVRAATLEIRGETYIKAAWLSGLTSGRIMVRHVLPRLAGPIIVQLSLFAAAAVLVQSALSFLGLSTPETQGPSWGNMVGEASDVVSQDPWLLVPTGGVLVLTVLALGLLGDALRDVTAGRHLAPSAPRRHRVGPGAPAGPVAPAGWPAAARPAATDSLLEIRGLSIAFTTTADQAVTVVRDISFDVAAGEALGIVGESGCGKSVTVRALLGLLPPGGYVQAGSAVFANRGDSSRGGSSRGVDGVDLATMSERDFGRIRGGSIALIGQDPMNSLDPSFRVGSQLTEVVRRHNSGLGRHQAQARARELLALANFPDPERTLRKYPHEMSGGEQQRVSIALALAGNPRLLIADEPTTALDVTVQAEILALLRHLGASLGMAIILVTHDWGVLADLCDRAIVMYAGEMVEQATVDDLYRSPRHPYTAGLLAANPHQAPAGGTMPTIPGTVPAPAKWPVGCHFEPRCEYATAECENEPIPLSVIGSSRLTRCIHAAQMVTTR